MNSCNTRTSAVRISNLSCRTETFVHISVDDLFAHIAGRLTTAMDTIHYSEQEDI